MARAGSGLAVYALAYPFLTVAFGHRYPAALTFGVPCPTVILTVGLLLTVRGGVPLILAIVPISWGFIGGSAAVLLNVPTDYVLLGAGALLTCRPSGRPPRPRPSSLPMVSGFTDPNAVGNMRSADSRQRPDRRKSADGPRLSQVARRVSGTSAMVMA